MKKLIVLITFFLPTLLKSQPEYILLEHVGISDKSILAIVISMEDSLMYLGRGTVCKVREDTVPLQKALKGTSFKLDKKLYVTLKKIILSYKESAYKGYDFGSFKITNHYVNGQNLKYYLSKTTSIGLFQKLINIVTLVDSYEQLLLQLKETKKRLE